jgi:hypothetical protein
VMPNGFSMPPRYVRDHCLRTGYRPVPRDLWGILATRLARLYRDGMPAARGLALLGDARDAGPRVRAALQDRGLPDLARLVVMSPPYLRVVRYGASNWLRFWFMGMDPEATDRQLEMPAGIDGYLGFLRDVLRGLRAVLAADAVVVMIVGDVERDRGKRMDGGIGLAEAVWSAAAEPEGYRLAGIVLDDVPPERKLTRLWGDEAGRATATDRLLVMAPSELGRRRALASADLPIDWRWPPIAPRSLAILRPYAADVPPRRPRRDGPAGPDEEPRPRADDVSPPELRAAAAGAPVRP